ncbi:MAG: methyl-accepting chemotaxis protein [Clostridiales bacterium]|nr:methyl-accepting chemotaxis protein [Clostridiales bacterium]
MKTRKIKPQKKAKTKKPVKKTSFLKGIKLKLIVSVLIPVIGIVVLGISSYSNASSAIVTTYKNSLADTMNMTVQYLTLALSTEETNFKDYPSTEEMKYYFAGRYDKTKMETLCNNISYKFVKMTTSDELISNVYFLSDNYPPFTTSKPSSDKLYSQYKETPQGTIAAEDKYNTYWFGVQEDFDSVLGVKSDSYSIRMVRHFELSPVYMIVDISSDTTKDALNKLIPEKGAIAGLITCDEQEFLTGAVPEKDDTVFTDQSFYKDALKSNKVSSSAEVTYNGQKYLFLYSKVEAIDGMITSLVPMSTILAKTKPIRNLTIAIVLITSIIAILIGSIIAQGIGSTIRKILKVLSKVEDGDLTPVVKTKRKDEFLLLTNGINHMISHMKNLIQDVNTMSFDVAKASSQVSDSSTTFVQTAQDIKYAIEEIETGVKQLDDDAAACLVQMDTLSEKISLVNENTETISAIASHTNQAITAGISTMQDLNTKAQSTTEITGTVIESIKALEIKSRSIGEIVNVMNEIAEQTNLLSLNASIEAARAGEAGRGFAVVADEIRKLADQSVESASKINDIIADILKNTNDAVDTAKEAENIVKSQASAVSVTSESFNEMKRQVASLMQELEAILQNVENMDQSRATTLQTIQSISAFSEETAAAASSVTTTAEKQLASVTSLDDAAGSLTTQTQELAQTLQQFKVQ